MNVEQKKIVKLTPKQDKFCRCIVSGMSGKDSYMESYNCQSESAAMVESTKLLKRDDINARLTELRKPIENLVQSQAISEYERLKELAWERIEECKRTGDDSGIARYIDIINKMSGTYININRNIDDKPTEIDHLDTDTLRRLAETQ